MDNREIIDMAIALDFADAQIINTEEIEFMFEFRKYCEDNLCGKFGANYSCPPDCGTAEEMRERVMRYKKALVLRSGWKIDDFSQREKIDSAKRGHNSAMLNLIRNLKAEGKSGLMAGASGCNLCDECQKIKDEPCRHPELSFSCLSAYCINVKALADVCDMDYTYKDGILSFFGVYFFENK